MTMRVWLLVALLMGLSAPGWAVCADGMIMPLPPAEGEQAPPVAEAEEGGEASGEDGAQGNLVLIPGQCYTPQQLASLPGAVPAIPAMDPEGTDVAAGAFREAQQARGGGSGGGGGGSLANEARGGDVAVAGRGEPGGAQVDEVLGGDGSQRGGISYNDAVAGRAEPVIGNDAVGSYESAPLEPAVAGRVELATAGDGTDNADAMMARVDAHDAQAEAGPATSVQVAAVRGDGNVTSDVDGGRGFWSEPVPDATGRTPTDAEMRAQVLARNEQDAEYDVERVTNRTTMPDETTRWTAGLARDEVLGTLGNAAARAQDPSTNVGGVCARAGLDCADPRTIRLAGIKSGLESGFGAARSSVTASGRVDQGSFNHFSPERIDYLNARYNTGWTREEVYGNLDRQAELALIDTAHNLRLADSRMTNAGLTYADAGITREQFAYCINTRGETGCTVTNAINDFRITDPNVARERGVAYVPNFQRNAERHSDTVTTFLNNAGTFTGQLSGVTMTGLGLTGARTTSVAVVGNVLGTGQALLAPAQQMVAQLGGDQTMLRSESDQAMQALMQVQMLQQMQQQVSRLGSSVGTATTDTPNTAAPVADAKTFAVEVFDPSTVGKAAGAGVTPASANRPAVPVVPVSQDI